MEGGEPLSKKAQKKLEKQRKKEQQKEERKKQVEAQTAAASADEGPDVSAGRYGALPLLQSRPEDRKGREFLRVRDFSAASAGQRVLFRARLHSSRKTSARLLFLVLRQREATLQGVVTAPAPTSLAFLRWLAKVPPESIVDIEGELRPAEVKGCSQQDVEVAVDGAWVVSESAPALPLQLEDAERPEPLLEAQRAAIAAVEAQLADVAGQLAAGGLDSAAEAALKQRQAELEKEKETSAKFVDLSRKHRLDNRVVDLRTTTNQAIFRIQSGVCQLFRDFLLARQFTEIHTPKLIGAASEGGANVFKLDYFGQPAFLAQSPQLFKQMCICADMERVFEVAPVFRAENSNTHRHMTEFTGLDLEMTIQEHYHEVLDVLEGIFFFMFEQIPVRFAKELAVINRQFPFEPLRFDAQRPLRLTFKEAMGILRTALPDVADDHDINTAEEKLLGQLVREKYGTDFYLIDKFPLWHRPFYTMPDPVDGLVSNSYDFFIRGEEILSGAQRVHDPALLEQRALEKGIPPETLKDYIDSFRFGAPPHGGGGIGLERVVMLYLNLGNIRSSTLYPRTPNRIRP